MKLRTFIALEPAEVHKQAILNYLNIWSRAYPHGISWVKPENLHLTTLFIGDTQSSDLEQIKAALFELILRTPCFELKCKGFELFPAAEPRLLWVKQESSDNSIFAFAKELKRTVAELGLEPDAKSLRLHITAGRIKSQQPVHAEREFLAAALPAEAAIYDTVTFYQSILKPEGPVYTPLEQYTLKNTII